MANKKQKSIIKLDTDDFIDSLTERLKAKGRVKVVRLGIFQVRTIAARKGYNVRSGKMVDFPAVKKVSFKPAKNLKEAIQ